MPQGTTVFENFNLIHFLDHMSSINILLYSQSLYIKIFCSKPDDFKLVLGKCRTYCKKFILVLCYYSSFTIFGEWFLANISATRCHFDQNTSALLQRVRFSVIPSAFEVHALNDCMWVIRNIIKNIPDVIIGKEIPDFNPLLSIRNVAASLLPR